MKPSAPHPESVKRMLEYAQRNPRMFLFSYNHPLYNPLISTLIGIGAICFWFFVPWQNTSGFFFRLIHQNMHLLGSIVLVYALGSWYFFFKYSTGRPPHVEEAYRLFKAQR